MYVITVNDGRIVGIGKHLDYMEGNGYPRLTDENIAFIPDNVIINESVEVPDEIMTNPNKYFYSQEKGFYLNPDYIEPDPNNTYGISDELFSQIKSDYRKQIAQEVNNG